jgi:NAD(P)-dependent dehydrogenase (short-subunit alcohol dehydrogenase family)
MDASSKEIETLLDQIETLKVENSAMEKQLAIQNAHPAFAPGRVAVITGASSGIGLAMAMRCASFGMKVVLADNDTKDLPTATAAVEATSTATGSGNVLAIQCDVSKMDDVQNLKDQVYEQFGEVAVLMNNAGVGVGGGPGEKYEQWKKVIDVNLWGVINGVQAFMEAMVAQGTDGLIINTGSKQGITCPPGNLAYNVSKAGVKVMTEGVQHALREKNSKVSAFLLVPGWTNTSIELKADQLRKGADHDPEKVFFHAGKPAEGAWMSDQVIDYMLEKIGAGQFYIICPDNDVSVALDKARIAWACEDITKSRPPLSRWHPDHADEFKKSVEGL